MSSPNKPVTGRDVANLRLKLGLSTDEMAYMLGTNKNRYHFMVNTEADLPVRSIPTAIMVRLLEMDETLNFMPSFPSPQELYKMVEPFDITKREFSVILGNHGTSMQRWERFGKRAIPQVYRLCRVIQNLLNKKGGYKTIEMMKLIVNTEGSLLGVENILSTGRWNAAPPKTKDDISKASLERKNKIAEAEAEA